MYRKTHEYWPNAICICCNKPLRLYTPYGFATIEEAKEVISIWASDNCYSLLASWIDSKTIIEFETRTGKQETDIKTNKISWEEYRFNYD